MKGFYHSNSNDDGDGDSNKGGREKVGEATENVCGPDGGDGLTFVYLPSNSSPGTHSVCTVWFLIFFYIYINHTSTKWFLKKLITLVIAQGLRVPFWGDKKVIKEITVMVAQPVSYTHLRAHET